MMNPYPGLLFVPEQHDFGGAALLLLHAVLAGANHEFGLQSHFRGHHRHLICSKIAKHSVNCAADARSSLDG